MTSFPVKMTSPQSSFQWKSRSWVDLSAKKNLGGLDQPAACWISYKTPYFSDSNLWKNPHFKKKITNQTSFSTKSTTLNPMVKSDLVTYRGGTIRFLFFSVANMIATSMKNLIMINRYICAISKRPHTLIEYWKTRRDFRYEYRAPTVSVGSELNFDEMRSPKYCKQ